MSIQNAETETEAKPPNRQTIADWAEKNGLDGWLLPLKTRNINPIELTQTFATSIRNMPKTQSTFKPRNIGVEQLTQQYKGGIERFFGLRECDLCDRNTRYLNPQYMHYGHTESKIKKTPERLEFYERYKHSPTIGSEWFATHFGVAKKGLWSWFGRQGIDWPAQQKRNKARLGRTIWTIAQWDDIEYGLYDLSRIIPTTTETVRNWSHRHGKNCESWSAPKHPADKAWYKSHKIDD